MEEATKRRTCDTVTQNIWGPEKLTSEFVCMLYVFAYVSVIIFYVYMGGLCVYVYEHIICVCMDYVYMCL